MEHAIDLESYLRRVGHRGEAAPTIETLRALSALHPAAIAFENLSPFAGAPVPLDLASLERKLIHEGRGGYCFEQNGLFLAVLRALGFRATGLAARVLWNQEGAVRARSHMLVKVELDEGVYVADVGFGGQTPTAPLRLELDVAQPTPHERFRLVRGADGDIRMQAEIRGEWRSLYRFDLTPQYAVDYAVSNYFLSTSPSSHFRTSLIASRAIEGRRYALLGRQLATHPTGGETERRTLAHDEVRGVLEDTFGIRVPRTPELDAAIEALA
jgi:N-hydroxyarylamine O-acetyltransferase